MRSLVPHTAGGVLYVISVPVSAGDLPPTLTLSMLEFYAALMLLVVFCFLIGGLVHWLASTFMAALVFPFFIEGTLTIGTMLAMACVGAFIGCVSTRVFGQQSCRQITQRIPASEAETLV